METLLVILLMMSFLAVLYGRDQRRHRRWRRGLLSCHGAPLDGCELRIVADGFPRLEGVSQGRHAEIRVLRDDATPRKLPSLWLSVTLEQHLANWPTVDIVARFRNTEYFTLALDLPYRLEPLAGWPDELLVKCSESSASLQVLSPHAIEYFSDPRAKEILITPRGVRMLYQLDQARRADYLVLRAGDFDTRQAPPALMQSMLARAHALLMGLEQNGAAATGDPVQGAARHHVR